MMTTTGSLLPTSMVTSAMTAATSGTITSDAMTAVTSDTLTSGSFSNNVPTSSNWITGDYAVGRKVLVESQV